MSVLILRPNSDNSVEQTRSPATASYNYACIDEETKSRTDYTYSNGVVPMLDIYGFPNHSSESGTINSVTIKAYANNNDGSGSAGSINFVIKISSTVYVAGVQNTSETETLYSSSWATNPATSSAWSWTEIDDLLAGDYLGAPDVKSASHCYQLWVEVDYTEGGASLTKGLSDTITLSDAIIKQIGQAKADSFTLNDSIGKAFGTAKSDNLTLSDAIAKSASKGFADTFTLSENIIKAFGLNKSDSITLSEALVKSFGKAAADTLSLSDSVSKFRPSVYRTLVIAAQDRNYLIDAANMELDI